MAALAKDRAVAVIGAGAMGAGIAQVAAQAGHTVYLYDVAAGAPANSVAKIDAALNKQVQNGKLTLEQHKDIIACLIPTDVFEDLASATLFIEAIAEDMAAKRALFAKLEGIASADAIFATNTSTLSVTAMAAGLARPERLAGMHFFNPAVLMKLVEVVRGMASDPGVLETLEATAQAWGKVTARCRSTPGFIVNRVARPYYAEALRLLEEGVGDPATLDAIMTECGGFRMGPFSLMDLIGNDINYRSTRSVFEAYAADPRYRPSLIQQEMVEVGWLGRKSGRGFYRYGATVEPDRPSTEGPSGGKAAPLNNGWEKSPVRLGPVLLVPTDGRRAADIAREQKCPVAVHDLRFDSTSKRIVVALSHMTDEVRRDVLASLQAVVPLVTVIPDWPGLVAMRTVSMLVNEAFEAVLQGVADGDAIDRAMKYGVNYPYGPVQWGHTIGLARIVAVLEAIHADTGDPRYRVAMNLRHAVRDAA
ncbi:MAG: 3-hydroxyacyl-CoA dehydrogenase NAD-binding domain-containing protein [Pseudolabrys sp.]|nr:3-hydroxyacyl-CoA dehydrogenase NAD-binding domain-containing protein [Pseudolabrys sp.]MDP2293887.1 3-hydroxyacyl-CoA dehydrogenase NAD-binding domain-containing protein [Pseudolabrys sp.]